MPGGGLEPGPTRRLREHSKGLNTCLPVSRSAEGWYAFGFGRARSSLHNVRTGVGHGLPVHSPDPPGSKPLEIQRL